MDVEVNGAGMVWVLGHHALKLGHDRVCASFRLPTAVGPVIPRLGVHHGFGMKNGDLGVVRKALGDVSERIRPGLVQRVKGDRAPSSKATARFTSCRLRLRSSD